MMSTLSSKAFRNDLPSARAQSPIPVLLTVRELGSGGIERDVTKLALALDRSRFLPYVATYQLSGPRYEELKRAEVPVIELRISSFKSPSTILAAIQFAQLVKGHRIQVLHAFDSTAVFSVPLARLLGVPVVLASALGHRALLDRRTLSQLRFTDRLVDGIVVNCKAMREHLINDYSISHERIELCYNGVDTKEFWPSRPLVAPSNDSDSPDLTLGTVCVLRPEKGLEILQEAFAKVLPYFPRTKLLIVGSGPELDKLNSNRARLGIQETCVIISAVAKVAPFLRAMDIFVSSSYSEAFSNSILEAMACGCCVVGSRVGGTPELIGEQERGLLFTAGDVEELAQKLMELIQNASLRRKLGERAAEFAAKALTMEIAVRRTMEIYERLLSRKPCFGVQELSSKRQ